MKRNQRGISLIVLVITIIVVIILAAAVILSLGENNPINDAKIASLTQTKDSMESSVHLFLSKGITQTQGVFSNLQLMTGMEGLPTSEEPVLKQGAVDYKFVVGASSKPAIAETPAFIPDKVHVKIENGEEKWLYQIDKSKYEEKVAKGYKTQTSDSNWYVDPEDSRIYLIFNKGASYPQWMIGKDKRVDVNLVDFVGNLYEDSENEEKPDPEEPNIPDDENWVTGTEGANAPEMLQGMLAVYYDKASNTWKKADETNQNASYQWYDYGTTAKKWANVVTVESAKRAMYQSAAVGTTIDMADINTMWVWIPRYAYSIQGGAYKKVTANTQNKIEVKFLKGSSNKAQDGVEYPKDYDADTVSAGSNTPFIVHPAFTLESEELKGIWVAKFEASASKNSNGRYPGEYYKSATMNAYNDYPYVVEPLNANTYLKIVPGASSWRGINIDNACKQCSYLRKSRASIYGWSSSNAHLMKNVEWGAIAYLCASKYGKLPKINAEGQYVTWKSETNVELNSGNAYINIKTGTSNYASTAGMETSTTGNIYGIYDMSGGTWEYVSAYLDNKNENLKNHGSSLINAVSKYKEVYRSSSEERNNIISNTVTGTGTLTQSMLWNKVSITSGKDTYNSIRSRLSSQNYQLMKGKKGDAMYEVIQEGNYSFLGRIIEANGNSNYNWMKDATTNNKVSAYNWDSDYTYIGHSNRPFILRGGVCGNGAGAGVFALITDFGSSVYGRGFRPVVSSSNI